MRSPQLCLMFLPCALAACHGDPLMPLESADAGDAAVSEMPDVSDAGSIDAAELGPPEGDSVPAGTTCSGTVRCWDDSLTAGLLIYNIFGTSAADIWASGELPGHILHFDGHRWSTVAQPAEYFLIGVAAADADHAWSVGPRGTLIAWDGAQWNNVTGVRGWLNGVWAASATSAWLVGMKGVARHWDGSSWADEGGFTENDLLEIWGTSATDIYAVGARGGIFHRDGGGWSRAVSGSGQYNDVFGSSPTDVWVVGRNGVARHFDGMHWVNTQTGVTKELMGGFSAAPDDAWVVGQSGTILHWDGDDWQPVPCQTRNWLHAAWGGAADRVWIVGDDGAVLYWNGDHCAPLVPR